MQAGNIQFPETSFQVVFTYLPSSSSSSVAVTALTSVSFSSSITLTLDLDSVVCSTNVVCLCMGFEIWVGRIGLV